MGGTEILEMVKGKSKSKATFQKGVFFVNKQK
jgi:hypothetical protein